MHAPIADQVQAGCRCRLADSSWRGDWHNPIFTTDTTDTAYAPPLAHLLTLVHAPQAARVEGLYLSPTRIVDAARDLMAGR